MACGVPVVVDSMSRLQEHISCVSGDADEIVSVLRPQHIHTVHRVAADTQAED